MPPLESKIIPEEKYVKPNFAEQISMVDPTVDFKDSLMELFDAMLKVDTLTDTQKEKVARLRARTEIDLIDFSN